MLAAVGILCGLAAPAHAIVWCHDYTLWEASGRTVNENRISPEDLRYRLGTPSMGFRRVATLTPFTPGADGQLRPGDVIIWGQAHSGFVNAAGRIDHFVQTAGRSGTVRTPENAMAQPNYHRGQTLVDVWSFTEEGTHPNGQRYQRRPYRGEAAEVWRREQSHPDRAHTGFTGEWATEAGPTVILVKDGHASGSYTRPSGSLSGQVSGRELRGRWRDRSGEGELHLRLSPDGRRFTGERTRNRGSGPQRTPLNGVLVAPGEPEQPDGREPVKTSKLTLQAAKRRVLAGQVVQVPIWLIHGKDLAGLRWELSYDPRVVRPEGEGLKGNLLAGIHGVINTKKSAAIIGNFGKKTALGVPGSGTVAEIRFRAVGPEYARARLRLKVWRHHDAGLRPLAVECIDGLVLIVGKNSLVTGSSGGVPPVPPPPPGRGSGQGPAPPPPSVLTPLDALRALKMDAGLIARDLNLDVNNDGEVDTRDAVLILQDGAAAAARRRKR
jgi:hypothetical protein